MYFTLVTEDGTKYIFNNEEITQNNSCSGDPDIYTSAWYLTQIILPKSKRTINIEYVADPGIAIPNTSMTETWGRNYGYANTLQGCPSPTVPVLSTCNTTRVQRQQKIKKITYPGGTVTFNYNFQRTDLSAFTTESVYTFSEVVFSNGSITTEKYLLNYITPDRLRLSAVSTADASDNVILMTRMGNYGVKKISQAAARSTSTRVGKQFAEQMRRAENIAKGKAQNIPKSNNAKGAVQAAIDAYGDGVSGVSGAVAAGSAGKVVEAHLTEITNWVNDFTTINSTQATKKKTN